MTKVYLSIFAALTFTATSLWAESSDDAGFQYPEEHIIYTCNPELERC